MRRNREFCKADKPERMNSSSHWPRLIVVTQRELMQPSFDLAILHALRGGARWIQLRAKDLPPRELLAHALKAQKLCEKFGAQISINTRADIARAIYAQGLHLPENEIAPRQARLSLDHHARIGVSCHSPETVQRAIEEGADYLIYGSIFPTASHPDQTPQGLDSLREVCASSRIPVYAIGGVTAENAASCLEAGARGVATIGATWTENIETDVRALLTALDDLPVVVKH